MRTKWLGVEMRMSEVVGWVVGKGDRNGFLQISISVGQNLPGSEDKC